MSNEREQLLKTYRKLAKRADQRLVRLEGYRHDKGFKGITEYAYKTAMRDIKSWSGARATRFNTAPPPENPKGRDPNRLLKEKIADIEKFLASPTSTKKGTLAIHKKRADALNKSEELFGDEQADFTWQEWANFWEKVGSKYHDKNIDYRIAAKVIYMEKKSGLNRESLKNMSDIDFNTVDFDNEKEVKKVFGKKISEMIRTGDLDEIELEQMQALARNGITYKDLK